MPEQPYQGAMEIELTERSLRLLRLSEGEELFALETFKGVSLPQDPGVERASGDKISFFWS